MSISTLLNTELNREAINTRKLLQCVPDAQADWKPHDKSFSLSRMASHVAELPIFLKYILETDELDMSTLAPNRKVLNTSSEMLQAFDERLAEGRKLLEDASDEYLMQPWTFRAGERIVAQDTRYNAIRSWMINHQIHHRGQLSVYLRLLDVPIPGMYGPSADDIIAREAKAAAHA